MRFPVADEDGSISYSRTFDLSDDVDEDDVRDGVIVQHGISELFADLAQYDGEPRSSIDPRLPLEATIPTDCGELLDDDDDRNRDDEDRDDDRTYGDDDRDRDNDDDATVEADVDATIEVDAGL